MQVIWILLSWLSKFSILCVWDQSLLFFRPFLAHFLTIYYPCASPSPSYPLSYHLILPSSFPPSIPPSLPLSLFPSLSSPYQLLFNASPSSSLTPLQEFDSGQLYPCWGGGEAHHQSVLWRGHRWVETEAIWTPHQKVCPLKIASRHKATDKITCKQTGD